MKNKTEQDIELDLNLGDGLKNVCQSLYDKASYAFWQLESRERTIINIEIYEATVLCWAIEEYMRKRYMWGDE